MSEFTTKDSGERAEFTSGMVRDTEKGKPRFDLLLPLGIPYAEQMLTRDAQLMARGAEKYEARNWEKARGETELARYRSSALRHLMQWIAGETDEDHAAAVRFNIMAGEYVQYRLRSAIEPVPQDAEQRGNPEYEFVGSDCSVGSCKFCSVVEEIRQVEPEWLFYGPS